MVVRRGPMLWLLLLLPLIRSCKYLTSCSNPGSNSNLFVYHQVKLHVTLALFLSIPQPVFPSFTCSSFSRSRRTAASNSTTSAYVLPRDLDADSQFAIIHLLRLDRISLSPGLLPKSLPTPHARRPARLLSRSRTPMRV